MPLKVWGARRSTELPTLTHSARDTRISTQPHSHTHYNLDLTHQAFTCIINVTCNCRPRFLNGRLCRRAYSYNKTEDQRQGKPEKVEWCSYYSMYIGYTAARAKYGCRYILGMFMFIVCHSGRATIFYFHKHVSWLETSISLIFLVCLTRLHVMRLAALEVSIVVHERVH